MWGWVRVRVYVLLLVKSEDGGGEGQFMQHGCRVGVERALGS